MSVTRYAPINIAAADLTAHPIHYVCTTTAELPSSGLKIGDTALAADTNTIYKAGSATTWTPTAGSATRIAPTRAYVYWDGAAYRAKRPDGTEATTASATFTTVCQAAIDEVAATADVTGGGTVFVAARADSAILVATPLVVRSGVVLQGEGHSGRLGDAAGTGSNTIAMGTVLKSNAASLAAVIDIVSSTATFAQRGIGAMVRDLTVDGNSKQAVRGIRSSSGAAMIHDVVILSCQTGWQHVPNATFDLAPSFTGALSEVWDCTIGMGTSGGSITDGQINISRVLACGTGIDINGGGWNVRVGHMTASAGSTHIITQSQSAVQISDTLFDSASGCISVDGNEGALMVSGCQFYSPTSSPAGGAIVFNGTPSRPVIITGNSGYDRGSGSWVNFVRVTTATNFVGIVKDNLFPATNVTGLMVASGASGTVDLTTTSATSRRIYDNIKTA